LLNYSNNNYLIDLQLLLNSLGAPYYI